MTDGFAHDYDDAARASLRGFDAAVRTEEYFGSFKLAEAIRSLTETTRSRPVTVLLRNSGAEDDPSYPVVISLARPLWIREEIGDGDIPNWLFEGWILSYGPLPVTRVRIHVARTGLEAEFAEDDIFTWQSYVSDEDPGSVSWR